MTIHFDTKEIPISKLVDHTFPKMDTYHFDSNIFTKRTILAPKNDDVDVINEILISKLLGKLYVYKSFD